MKRNNWKVYIILALIISLTACSGNITGNTLAEKETIKIAYIGPLTGPSAVLGMDVPAALEIAVDEANAKGGINGKQIKLIIEDDQYSVSNAVTAYNKVVHADGVDIVLLTSYGGLFSLEETAKNDGVILIDVLDCNQYIAGLNENVFCIGTETESIGYKLAEYSNKHDLKNIGIIYTTRDSFMVIVKDAFKQRAEEYGIKTKEFHYLHTEKDFQPYLTKAMNNNPDALLLLGHEEIGTIMKRAREMGYKGAFLSTGVVTSPSLQKASQGTTEGTIFAYWASEAKSPEAQAFEKKFTEKVGRLPILPLTTHPAYDTMNILLKEVLPANGNITLMKERLYDVKGYKGATGEVNILPDGTNPIEESIFVLVDGQAVAEEAAVQ